MRFQRFILFTLFCFLCLGENQHSQAEEVVARVNGREVYAKDVQLDFFMRQFEAAQAPPPKEELIHRIVDRELIRQFLEKRKVQADELLLEKRMNFIREFVKKKGDDLQQVLAKVGLDEETLQEMLALQIAWNIHVTRTLTETRIESFWKEHKFEFDGTKVTGAQIFKMIPDAADERAIESQLAQLNDLRNKVLNGEATFAEAAKQHSQSPSAEKGGDLGEFEFHGDVADEIAENAFQLKPGEISPPFLSRYGIHIVQVRERQPGELSLEDARPAVVKALSQTLWKEQVIRERKTARITIVQD